MIPIPLTQSSDGYLSNLPLLNTLSTANIVVAIATIAAPFAAPPTPLMNPETAPPIAPNILLPSFMLAKRAIDLDTPAAHCSDGYLSNLPLLNTLSTANIVVAIATIAAPFAAPPTPLMNPETAPPIAPNILLPSFMLAKRAIDLDTPAAHCSDGYLVNDPKLSIASTANIEPAITKIAAKPKPNAASPTPVDITIPNNKAASPKPPKLNPTPIAQSKDGYLE